MTSPQRVRPLFLCLAAALLLSQQAGRSQTPTPPDALRFFKNYFGTIDYVVAGKGLEGQGGSNGLASGTINMTGAPAGAEPLAAFLYWQVITDNGPDTGSLPVRFNGQQLSSPGPPATPTGGPIGVVGDPAGSSPCWSSGGGSGGGGVKRTFSYRADVLRFLPVVDGRQQINGAHTFQLPDNGSANNTPRALGASLLVVYRHPDPAAPMNAVVLYDGSWTMNNATPFMSQTIKGYYDPAPGVAGQITLIGGSAQANKPEWLRAPAVGLNELNPFQAVEGLSWDNVTRATTSPAGDSFNTTVNGEGLGTFDCITFTSIVYRTRVNDTDGDGLLNRWESSTTPILDPNGEALPLLGTDPGHKDLFIEIGYFETAGPLTYQVASTPPALPVSVTKPQHSHRPTHAALKKVGDAFRDAPVPNPVGGNGINVHFDLGNTFPAGEADPYIVRGGLARGGESMDETITVCTRGPSDPPWVCQFSNPGTVGWKTGFRFLRDSPIGLSDDACEAAERDGNPATVCERRFDRNRKDIFRYVLFAHALGIPREPCIEDDPLDPDFGFPDEHCQDTDPNFHIPNTYGGVGDFLGGDAMVTLGAFDNAAGWPVGTDYFQATTLMHELGHTFGLGHGGADLEPNCKPNYFSVMNYLFQLRGLRDEAGQAHVDFSGQSVGAIDELSLSDPGVLTPAPMPAYRAGWYAPQGPGTTGTPAARHCDGRPRLSTDPVMVRVDSTSATGGIDWNKSPDPPSASGQDLNFDGVIGTLNAGHNDWANIRLNQLGSRRNVGGWYWVPNAEGNDYVAFIGPLSLSMARNDFGSGDLSLSDLGSANLLGGDLSHGDLNYGDLGRMTLARNDFARNDFARNDFARNDFGSGSEPEASSGLAAAAGYGPPTMLTASVVGLSPDVVTSCVGLTPAQCHRIRLRWGLPDVGLNVLTQFRVFRRPGGGGAAVQVGPAVPAVLGVLAQTEYTLIDQQELPNGPFTYYVVADFAGDSGTITSDESNNVTPTAVNDAPVATGESHSTTQGVPLVVATPGVLGNDTDVDSPSLTAELVTGPTHGTLALNANGSFTYTPAAGFFGADAFTYRARDVDPTRGSNVVTVSLTVNALYGFVNVQNLPPGPNKTFKRGTTATLKWRFTIGGVVVDSNNAQVSVAITAPGGSVFTFTPQAPGSSSFTQPTANQWTWEFNWLTVFPPGHPQAGQALPAGDYLVRVTSGLTGQTFPATLVTIRLVN